MPLLILSQYVSRHLILLAGTGAILVFVWSFHAAFHPYYSGQYDRARLIPDESIQYPDGTTVGEQGEPDSGLFGDITYTEVMSAGEDEPNVSSDIIDNADSDRSLPLASFHSVYTYSTPTKTNEASSKGFNDIEPPYLDEYVDASYGSQSHRTHEPTFTSPPSAPSATSTPLILYAYSDSTWAFDNLKFFLTHGVHSQATFHFIINGAITESTVPPSISQALDLLDDFQRTHTEAKIQVVPRRNECYDMGAYGEVLLATNSSLYNTHKYFILVNASVRGPLVPMWSRECWSDAYLFPVVSGFQDEEGRPVKMVGMTQNCNWAGPNHVQSMVLAMDQEAMGILLGIIPTRDDEKDVNNTETTIDPEGDAEREKTVEDITGLKHNDNEEDEDENLERFRNKVAATEVETTTPEIDDILLTAADVESDKADAAETENASDEPPFLEVPSPVKRHHNVEARQSSSLLPHTADGHPIYNLALCPRSMSEAVHVEWSLTQLLLKHNYTATSMLALSHANHFSLSSAPGTTTTYRCTNGDANARAGAYEGHDLHFWETMFIKVRWAVMAEAVDRTSAWLDRVVEGAWEQYGATQPQAGGSGDEHIKGAGWGLRRGSWDVCRNELLNWQKGRGR